jgi:menaquinone-9 beta-reductase
MRADVLVVGAGPGGSATSYHLARQGLDVILVDKARFPREKVCGDGLTPYGVRAIQRMGLDPMDPGFTQVYSMRTYGGGVVLELPWPTTRTFPDLGVVRTRYEFDHLLAVQAETAGVRFLQGVEATRPLMDDGWVAGAELREDGRSWNVAARFVVAADGASGRFAAQAGVVRDQSRPLGIAARRYYRIPRRQDPVIESFLTMRDERFGGVLPGYGWIFPLGDGLVNVGAGLLNTYTRFKEMSARKVLDIFVAGLPPEWGVNEDNAVAPALSGPIPMGINRRPIAVPGMLVVGDAAGVTNPWNGEGIGYAMESGELAAELLSDAIALDRPAVAQMYPILMRERYGRYFAVGNRWVGLLGHPGFMRFAVKHAFPRKRLMAFALRVMANITDGKDGDAQDRLIHALGSMVPA